VVVGAGDDPGRQEPAVLAEGDEQDAVEGLLRGGEQVAGRDGRVVPAQLLEGRAAQDAGGALRDPRL
jgi:hypothetical protein